MGRRRWAIVFVTALLALTACSSDPSEPLSPDASAPALITDTPEPSGDIDSVTFALYYEPTSINWVYSYNYAENTALANMCENLMRLTPEYEIVPSLAEAADHPDPRTWVYTIRQDVTFHDGSPMTTEDVVWSLNRHLDPDVGSYFGSFYANVDSVEQTGDWEVTVTLKKPDLLFPQMMATPAGGVESQAFVEKAGEDYGTPDGGVNCTGPFEFTEWNKGENLVLTRYEEYWNSDLRPFAARVELPFIDNESTLTSALLSGEVDGTYEVPPASIEQLQQADSGTLYFGPSMQSYNVIINNFDGPLGDPRIRRALMLALDREGIVSAAVNGQADPLKAIVPPSSWGYAEEIFQEAWDALPSTESNLEEAKALVQEAGVPTETLVLANIAANEQLLIMATAVQDAAKELGIAVEIQTLAVGKYAPLFFDEKAREGIDMFLTGWYTDIPEPLEMYGPIFQTGGGSNYNGYSNKEFDELIDKALATEDPEARAELVVKAQAISVEDVPWIPIYTPDVRVFLSDRVTGAPASFVYLYYPWAAELGAA